MPKPSSPGALRVHAATGASMRDSAIETLLTLDAEVAAAAEPLRSVCEQIRAGARAAQAAPIDLGAWLHARCGGLSVSPKWMYQTALANARHALYEQDIRGEAADHAVGAFAIRVLANAAIVPGALDTVPQPTDRMISRAVGQWDTLQAAAPELRDALVALLSVLDNQELDDPFRFSGSDRQAVEAARVLLARVEGGR